jgi:hypothetical protein
MNGQLIWLEIKINMFFFYDTWLVVNGIRYYIIIVYRRNKYKRG